MTLTAVLVIVGLGVLLLPAALAVLYLLGLTLLSWRLPTPAAEPGPWRFVVVVPAHNEAAGIGQTVASLRRLRWPSGQWRLVVVADNCTDATANLARQAGADVWERHDPTQRGKGHALQFALARLVPDTQLDAVVIVDADTQVSPNLLAACAARLDRGAEAVQVYHGVANPAHSWRTQLAAIAYGAFHGVRSRGRERLRLSAGLRGNGMCFRTALLRRVPFTLNSLAEDLEYGAILGLHGVRVHYADEARADADMVAQAAAAGRQRHRWEAGRLAVGRQYVGPLLRRAWRERDPVALELALELLTLPLAQLVLWIIAVQVLAAIAALFWPATMLWVGAGAALLVALALHVLRGWQLSGTGPTALPALARAPFYLAWKMTALIRERGTREWRRTDRDPP